MNWIRSSTPMQPFMECLQKIDSMIGSNKKKILGLLSDYTEWDEDARSTFIDAKELLRSRVMSSHFDSTQRLCIFPDIDDRLSRWALNVMTLKFSIKSLIKLQFIELKE